MQDRTFPDDEEARDAQEDFDINVDIQTNEEIIAALKNAKTT